MPLTSKFSELSATALTGTSLKRGMGALSLVAMLTCSAVRAQEAPIVDASPASVDSAPAREVPPVSAPAPSLPGDFSANPPAPAPTSSPSTSLGESYIDSTSYSIGATQRSVDAPRTVRLPQVPSSVQVGPLSVGSYGLAFGRTTPSARDYYFRTNRPAGVLGNGNIRLIFPLAIPAPITSLFGWRVHPITGEQRFHSGTDLGAPIGTPVLAAYAGKVALADFLGGYGLAVVLDHNKDTQQTLYGHLSEIFVKPGEWVKQGVVIGRVGDSGLSTGPHLHFEFRQLTPDGWVAMDAGMELEYSLAQLMKTMGIAQLPKVPGSPQNLELDLSATMDVNLQDQS